MSKLHVGASPLSNRIYCGRVSKDGLSWLSGKQDVTGEACAAVCQIVTDAKEPFVVTENGKPKWEITVKELKP